MRFGKLILQIFILHFCLLLCTTQTSAQYGLDNKSFQLGGYLQFMETVWLQNSTEQWLTAGTIKNRIDFSLYPVSSVTLDVGMRNILEYGDFLTDFPFYTDIITEDEGFTDLTWKWTSDTSSVLYTNIDRLNINYTLQDFSITLGRQRINWGVNHVWNPNDIFNVFSYFDFDYIERPGCDAVRIEYYTGMLSSLQAAVKVDHNDELTYAALYRFNYNNYDYQIMAGVMRDDMVFGGAWSGDIKGAGFNGEITYFRNKNNEENQEDVLIASAGTNYSFTNGLYIHTAIIFNSRGALNNPGGFNILAPDISAKNLTPARYEIMAETQYPITPLLKGTLAAIFNPGDGSAYFSPSLDFSLSNTVSFLAAGQIFSGSSGSLYGGLGKLFYARLKWNF